MRSSAREAVYKYLFAKMFNDETGDKFFEGLLNSKDLTENDKDFARLLKNTIEENLTELTNEITRLSSSYSFNRIFSMDKCAIYIGLAEIKYFDDIPDEVSADEAVKLSSKYSTDNSLAFVNGILAAYIKEKRNEC